MSRSRILLVVATALVLLVAAGVAWSLLRDSSPAANGPMRSVVEHGMLAEGDEGDRFTDGAEVLQLLGSKEAELVRVETVGGEETFRQLGVMVAGPDRGLAAINSLRGYPPRDQRLGEIVDAEGTTVQPRDETRSGIGYELLVGYEILDDTEVGYRSGLKVIYRVDGELFEWSSPARLLYCPKSMQYEECDRIATDDDWGE